VAQTFHAEGQTQLSPTLPMSSPTMHF